MEWKPLNKILPPLEEGEDVYNINYPGLRLKILDASKTPYISDAGLRLCHFGLYALSPRPGLGGRPIYQPVDDSVSFAWARAEPVNVDLDKFM